MNQYGALTIEARKVAKQTVAGRVIELTAAALKDKAPLERTPTGWPATSCRPCWRWRRSRSSGNVFFQSSARRRRTARSRRSTRRRRGGGVPGAVGAGRRLPLRPDPGDARGRHRRRWAGSPAPAC